MSPPPPPPRQSLNSEASPNAPGAGVALGLPELSAEAAQDFREISLQTFKPCQEHFARLRKSETLPMACLEVRKGGASKHVTLSDLQTDID